MCRARNPTGGIVSSVDHPPSVSPHPLHSLIITTTITTSHHTITNHHHQHHQQQDAIEIMSEALIDRCGGLGLGLSGAGMGMGGSMGMGGLGGGAASGLTGGLGLVDFRREPGSRGGKAAEAARFMAALRRAAAREGRDTFERGELQALARELRLGVRDAGALVDSLNEAGELLKRGPGQYKVTGVAISASQQAPQQSGSQAAGIFFAPGGGGGGGGGGDGGGGGGGGPPDDGCFGLGSQF